MKRTLILILLALQAGAALAAEPVSWGDQEYQAQFKYFIEQGAYERSSWEELAPEAREKALSDAAEPSQRRQDAMAAYYAKAMEKWDSSRLQDYCENTTADDVTSVKVWMGTLKGTLFENKLALARAMLRKAQAAGLEETDAAALRPHLTEDAIANLRYMKEAEALRAQSGGQFKKYELPKKTVDATINGVSGALSGNVERNMAKVFDGDLSAGVAGSSFLSGKYAVPKGAVNGAVSGLSSQTGAFVAGNTAAALGAPRATSASTIKSAAPASLDAAGKAKSTAWTSDAYGITVETAHSRQTYRDTNAAEAAIRRLPPGSVTKITLYGHGSPGMQTVGPGQYDALYTAELLDGKMAKNGVIQFSGCNTASIGDSTLNPAVGLSMVARRLLYFSLPYWQDRADGIPAAQAKQQWEKEWNADLSHDTSTLVKGAIVCGYRTFGLVPGRLPGLTRLMGNQEATEPGYVAGKKVCYQNGKEVPAP